MTTNLDSERQRLLTRAQAVDDADGLLEEIAAVHALRVAARKLETAVVLAAREAGESWQAIARPLGVSKQAAQKRFTPRPDPAPDPEPTGMVERPSGGRTGPGPEVWEVQTRRGRVLGRVIRSTAGQAGER